MKKVFRSALAIGVLAFGASAPAFATLELPLTGNSSGLLSILDSQNQRSLTIQLNYDFNALLPSILSTPSGFSIANAIGASDRQAVIDFVAAGGTFTWWVSAADNLGPGANGGRQVMTTSAGIGVTPSVTNAFVRQAAGAADNFYGRVNSVCGTARTCFADAAAEPGGTPDDFAAYAGNAWGAKWNNNLAFASATALGVAQGFFLLSVPESATAGNNSQAIKTLYGNAAGFGVWNLIVSGTSAVLSYTLSAVPLPAAAWLFLSGLLGLVTVARRKDSGAVAA